LITYLGQSLNVSTKIEREMSKGYLSGAHSEADLHKHVLNFINETVLCSHCGNPGLA